MLDIPLPQSSGRAEKALARGALAASDIPIPIDQLWNPATCPAAILPWLAWSLSVDEWDTSWPEEVRRNVIAESVMIHRRKGTLWACKRALALMGYGDCEIIEGWQTMVGGPWAVGDNTLVGGANHWAEYWVRVHNTITPAMVVSVARRLAAVAPARCRLTRIYFDAVAAVVGGPWSVGDVTITVGVSYALTEEI